MTEQIAVYTAVFGGYDDVRAPAVPVQSWTVFGDDDEQEPRRAARYCKALAHRLFPEADITIWLDGNVQLLIEPEWLVDEWLGDADIAATVHPNRDCLYHEAQACIKKRKDSEAIIRAQIEDYRAQGYPVHNGLAETRVVIRRNTPMVALFNEMWWSQIEHYSQRDQLSFNWALWRLAGLMPPGIVWNGVKEHVPHHAWFNYREHNRARR